MVYIYPQINSSQRELPWGSTNTELRPAGGDPGVDRQQKYFLTVCVSLSELGPSEPY